MEKFQETAMEDEKQPQPNYRGIKAMPFIIGNEIFEKLGTIGTSANLLIYMTTVFNMKNITATTLVNFFHGSTNFGTLFGAFLCDTFFGRYKTLGFSTGASFIGLLIIALTAAIKQLHPAHCGAKAITCEAPSPWQMTFLLAGFGFLIVGAGGIRPCNLAFGVDQFNPNTETGKRGIDSFFNWYFFTFTFAEMISLTLIVYVQTDISWAIGLSIPAALMLISTVVYFTGSRIYVKVKPQGSPLTSVVQVLVVAFKKRNLKLAAAPYHSVLFNHIPAGSINAQLTHTPQFRCLDKAAIRRPEDEVNSDGSPANSWRLCTLQQVEEVKCLARVIPIWASAILYFVAITQQNTYAIFQAVQSDRHIGKFQIPAASYAVFLMLALTLWLPIYDRIVVPILRRFTGNKSGGITVLQRMGTGIALSVVSMVVSGIVESKRRTLALTAHETLSFAPRKGAISPMSAMWLVPQLSLAGLAEAFTSVGEVEFFYKQFPENMKSLGGALFYSGMAIGSYLSNFLVSVVYRTTERGGDESWLAEDLNKGRLDLFYYTVAGLGLVNLGYFLVCASWYRYKGTGEDEGLKVEGKQGVGENGKANGVGFAHSDNGGSV